jgi:hypothetical protein
MAYKEIRYLPVFTDTSDRYEAFASSGISFADGTFYLMKRESVKRDNGMLSIDSGQLIAYHPDTGEEKVLLDEAEMGESVAAATPVSGGAVITFLKNPNSGYRLSKTDSEGEEMFSTDISLSGELINIWLLADSNGKCCLITREEIRLFDGEGHPAGTIDLSGKSVNQAVSNGGTVYLYD